MTRNNDGRMIVSIGDTELLKLWFHEGRGTGGQMGISLKGYPRMIRLTTFVRDGVLHYHLKDEDAMLWEDEITIDKTIRIVEDFMASIIRPYSPNQTYFKFSEVLANEIRGQGNTSSGNRFRWDLKPALKASIQTRPLERRKTTIYRGFLDGEHPGMIWTDDDDFLIIPCSENQMVRVNVDIVKTPLFKHPSIRGWFELFNYLERENILDKAGVIVPEKKRQLRLEIDGLLMDSILKKDR